MPTIDKIRAMISFLVGFSFKRRGESTVTYTGAVYSNSTATETDAFKTETKYVSIVAT
ncbi:hypothetical protein MNV_1850019 [Candidatus Methanoperedens nitroreducens]|uniref:Uncharacterized protein n=1 Tax=Candidatus Methanoperedens nitratireducens TaxID=1392998 RepID=A0A284VMK6_9EURY|nr:hypothetical protein MNV_1850019 [Candidatus Methanoperedens nitroreducens]